MTDKDTKPQAGAEDVDTSTDEGQAPESQQALPKAEADKHVKEANREAAKYRVKLREVEAELAKIKAVDDARKAAEMTEAERAKADLESARRDLEAARLETAHARSEAQCAHSGILKKYARVMTSDLLAAQKEDPSVNVDEWIAAYKTDHAELFGAAEKPAPESTGTGGPPPPKMGTRGDKIKALETELADLSSPIKRYRPGTELRRAQVAAELKRLRAN